MSVRVAQIRRENPIYNGQSTPHLIGNVNNWIKTTVNLQCYSLFESDLTSPIQVSSGNGRTVVKLLNGKWSDEGFKVGDEVYTALLQTDLAPGSSQSYVVWNNGPTAQLIWLSPDGTIAEFDDDINGPVPGAWIGDNNLFPTKRQEDFQIGYDKAYFFKDQEWDAIEVFHNLIPNSEKQGKSLNSIIDGSVTRFSKDGLAANNPAQLDMTQFGLKSGNAIKSVKVNAIPNGGNPSGRYNIVGTPLPDIDGNPTDQLVQPGQVITVYNVEIIHKIIGIEEDLTNLNDDTAPDWFFDADCLGDNFLFKVYPQYSNQNIFVASSMDSNLTNVDGNTGWIGENYNGRPQPYSIESIEYQNLFGTVISELDYGNESRVNILINNPNHTVDSIYTLNFQYLPNNEEQFKNNSLSYLNNTIQNTPIESNSFNGIDSTGLFKEGIFYPAFLGKENSDGARMDINSVQVFDQGGGQILLTFKTDPNNEFFDYMDQQTEDNRRYAIFVGCSDPYATIENSDSTELLAGYGELEFVPIPAGEYPGMNNLFNELPVQPNENGAATCIAFPEDLWLSQTRFTIDLTSGITFLKIKPMIELYNTVTGQAIELDGQEIDLQNEPVDGIGVQQINSFNSRGFLTIAAHDKNFLNCLRVPSDDVPPAYAYLLQFGFRIRYEDWIKNDDIPGDFYDINELNNGFNNFWTWLQQSDWVVRYSVLSTCDRVGTQVFYKNSFPIELNNYFELLDITPECRHYNNADNTSLFIGVDGDGLDVNSILGTGLTRIEQDYVLNSGTFPPSGIYAETNLEVFQGGGFKSMFTLSTEYQGETTNPLKPTGNNGVFLELILVAPNRLRAICLIDPSFLQGADTKYKISGRIGCSTGNKLPTLPDPGKYDVQFNPKYL